MGMILLSWLFFWSFSWLFSWLVVLSQGAVGPIIISSAFVPAPKLTQLTQLTPSLCNIAHRQGMKNGEKLPCAMSAASLSALVPQPGSPNPPEKSVKISPESGVGSTKNKLTAGCGETNSNIHSSTHTKIHSYKRMSLIGVQRKLPKKIMACRSDAARALKLLGQYYPHLNIACDNAALISQAISSHPLKSRKSPEWHQSSWTYYERLISILGTPDGTPDGIPVGTDGTSHLPLDGNSISATMEALRKSRQLETALHLMRLVITALHYNRGQHDAVTRSSNNSSSEIKENDDSIDSMGHATQRFGNDDNEVRKIYKSLISLLGHVFSYSSSQSQLQLEPRQKSSLLLYILFHHMPHVAIILPGKEMYHAVMNALGKCCVNHSNQYVNQHASSIIVWLLQCMEYSADSNESGRDASPCPSSPLPINKIPFFELPPFLAVRNNTNTSAFVESPLATPMMPPTVPPVDRMAYQTAISALAKNGHVLTAVDLLHRMRNRRPFIPVNPIANHDVDIATRNSTNSNSINNVDTNINIKTKQEPYFMPDINIYNILLIGIAKEAGKSVADGNSNSSSKNGDKFQWHPLALQLLEEMEKQSSSIQCSNMSNNNHHRHDGYNVQPTEQTYNSVIAACTKEGAWEAASMVSNKERRLRNNRIATELGLDSKSNRSNQPNELKPTLQPEQSVQTTQMIKNNSNEDQLSNYFKHLGCFRKIGKGRESWWEIGRYYTTDVDTKEDHGGLPYHTIKPNKTIAEADAPFTNNTSATNATSRRNIIIGLQPHKNPVRNGLSIVFYDGDSSGRIKLGRLLLKNAASSVFTQSTSSQQYSFYSSIIGMEVHKLQRGKGLSKLFIAIWLRICLMTNAYPRAAMMNKPLISLVLMHHFGFVPQEGGIRVELSRCDGATNDDEDTAAEDGHKNKSNYYHEDEDDYDPQFALYSASAKSIQGIFSRRTLRSQNIAIMDVLPHQSSSSTSAAPSPSPKRGMVIYIKTTFEHPIALTDNAVAYKPSSPFTMTMEGDKSDTGDERLTSSYRQMGIADKSHEQQIREQPKTDQQQNRKVQRQLLDDQIHSVLNTKKNTSNFMAHLDFFASQELLHRAFFSFAAIQNESFGANSQ